MDSCALVTEPHFLIDTSAWVWVLSPDVPADLRARVHHVLSEGCCGTTAMVMLELLGGARDERNFRESVEEFAELTQCR